MVRWVQWIQMNGYKDIMMIMRGINICTATRQRCDRNAQTKRNAIFKEKQ